MHSKISRTHHTVFARRAATPSEMEHPGFRHTRTHTLDGGAEVGRSSLLLLPSGVSVHTAAGFCIDLRYTKRINIQQSFSLVTKSTTHSLSLTLSFEKTELTSLFFFVSFHAR
uniref:(northern house mosquito) hypothetical protein n=1 Tax=Culex pipiens TaxID=7175 RepID=A0A8D8N7Y2_CULPI